MYIAHLPHFLVLLAHLPSRILRRANDIVEADLVLELQADGFWTTYGGTVDEVNNTVSYTFNDPVSFKAVTASSANATLTIEDIYPLDSRISVSKPYSKPNLHTRRKHFASGTL